MLTPVVPAITGGSVPERAREPVGDGPRASSRETRTHLRRRRTERPVGSPLELRAIPGGTDGRRAHRDVGEFSAHRRPLSVLRMFVRRGSGAREAERLHLRTSGRGAPHRRFGRLRRRGLRDDTHQALGSCVGQSGARELFGPRPAARVPSCDVGAQRAREKNGVGRKSSRRRKSCCRLSTKAPAPRRSTFATRSPPPS